MYVRLGLAVVALLAGCGSDGASSCGPSEAIVSSVIDGDTIVLDSGQHVRYLLIDATETTNGHNDCYGQEAKAFNTMLVLGQKVTLVYDSVCTDRYGRLLAYVTVNGREVNSLMVEDGYACVLYIPPDGMSRHDEFEDYQSEAMAAHEGIWGACEVVECAE